MSKLLLPRGGWLHILRYLALATGITFLATYFLHFQRRESRSAHLPHVPPFVPDMAAQRHPIDHLIQNAQLQQGQLLRKQSSDMTQAAARYRERRGRHPPPGFNAWFEYAKKHDAVVVEEFFDRIYHDLNPFWALEPKSIRIQANSHVQVIRVRNGRAKYDTDDKSRVPWIQLWTVLIKKFARHLPDVDIPVNYMDETRILVPWEKINEYIKLEQARRKMPPPDEVKESYPGLKQTDEARGEPYDPNWIGNEAPKYWDHTKLSCHPDSPGRTVSSLEDFSIPVEYPGDWMSVAPYAYKGYVQNFTASQDPCLQPHLRGLHGTFIESVSMSTTHELIPLFGGSKLPMNNEILIPGAMYITNDPFYSGGSSHGSEWSSKKDALVWRGVASGGRNKKDNWWHFHRHRWVQMMNGTGIDVNEHFDMQSNTFVLPPPEQYNLKAQEERRLGKWVSSFANVGFVNLECFPSEWGPGDPHNDAHKSKACSYTDPYFGVLPSIPMKEQYDFKYLPDVDGNSFSARWRGFLLSTSMPLKSTIYTEWHDHRLMPWIHFVPFDNTYADIYGIMDYFLTGRDSAAERIAEEGRVWAEQVLRTEDMALYVWRLLLEFARLCDEERDYLGYVGDLTSD